MRPPRSSPVWAIALSTLTFTHPVLSDERVLQQPLSQTSSHLSSPGASLNFSSPSPHIFHGTSSLLAQWPNTFFPNGHTLAAVTVPPYTHLYHGRLDSDPPPSPEWLAFDREMSYGIMGSTRNSHLLTYQTTRPVKLLYFDGESAALMGLGQLDSQMLLAFGNVTGPPPPEEGGRGLWGEYERAKGLCGWLDEARLGGRGWGFEGVVRMNAGFEVIWCDFGSASLRLVSWLNVTAPLVGEEEDDPDDDEGAPGRELGGERRETEIDATSYYSLPPAPTRTDRAVDPSVPPAPPNWRRDRDREPFLFSQGWGWFDSATWHYGSSGNGPGRGEERAKVDNCAILSFYSTQFVNQSLNRAVYERKTLNLTDEGLWKGEGAGNKTLALQQLARRRRYHHLGDMTSEEATLMRFNAEQSLRTVLEPYNDCSDTDWVLMASEIVHQTSLQIKMLEMKFVAFHNISSHNNTALRTWLFGFRAEIHMFTVGFMEYPDKRDLNSWIVGSELYNETYSRCRYHYTRLLVPEEGISLSPAEMEQRRAVEEVQGAICSVMLVIAFGVEQTWAEMFDQSERTQEKRKQAVLGMTQRMAAWHHELALLRAWLGWESDFTGCREVCGWDERCYIPMWPLLASRFGRGPPPPRGNGTQPSPPGYGHPPPHGRLPNGTSPGKPEFRMPPRGPWWMGDDTDLWEPKCVKAGYIMG